jgi:LAO/AO transport system kinase
MSDWAQKVLAKDTRATARVLRMIDDRSPGHTDILREIFPHTGRAHVVGITGNPGAGKSTLTDRIIEQYRKDDKKVAVICVDPTSPYSGGAILGDRIRMQRHATDERVFIRSVATRGHLGGLSSSARDMVRVFDAWGADVVLVETVGVGQDELEITRTAHTTVVVMAPGMGDEVQAIKAGIMESADVFTVNKADKEGADSTVRDIELMIALGSETMLASSKNRGHVVHGGAGEAAAHGATGARYADARWTPPITRAVATRGEGIAETCAAIAKHHTWVMDTEAGRARRAQRLGDELREALREALIEAASESLASEIERAVNDVAERTIDPYTAIDQLLRAFRG